MSSPNPNWKPGAKIPIDPGPWRTLDPQKLSVTDRYKLLIGSVIQRPIAFISTLNEKGEGNLAPFSFFNGVCSNPLCLSVSFARKADGSKKDTLINIESTGEFVVNTAHRWLAEPLVHCGAEFAYGVNEMLEAGLTPLPSVKVRPPRVKESAVQFECRLHSKLEIGDGSAGSATLVIGEVILLHAAASVYRDGKVDAQSMQPLARLGGPAYALLGETFELQIPQLRKK